MSEQFDIKCRGRLGPASGDDKSIRLLNRIIEWTVEGISYEADQRHVDIIISQLNLKKGQDTFRPVS